MWGVTLRRRFFVVCAPGVQPSAHFRAAQVAGGFLIGRPGSQCFLLEALAGFLAFGIVPGGFEHDQFEAFKVRKRAAHEAA